MKIKDALAIINTRRREETPGEDFHCFLACGFEPLHFKTLLTAELITRHPKRNVELTAGLFGDLPGNLELMERAAPHAGVVVVEWPDIDPRLGLRALGSWSPDTLADLVQEAAARLELLVSRVCSLVSNRPTAVVMPTIPMAPVFLQPPRLLGPEQARLHTMIAQASERLLETGAKILGPDALDATSPLAGRHDVASELGFGFPYTKDHAGALAALTAELICPKPPLKGVITDLDDTLWRGILGEAGPARVAFDMETKAQEHGLYQMLLESLAQAGILVAVASKNNEDLVEEVFATRPLQIKRDSIFPLKANWGQKSESVRQILSAWNIAADAVAFVDDSPMELAQVESEHPGITCLRFPTNDQEAVLRLIRELRSLCGKESVSAEDRIRAQSLKQAAAVNDAASDSEAHERFLKAAQAKVVISRDRTAGGERPFELINKTNQFNLNGHRLDKSTWNKMLSSNNTIFMTVSYEDKYGPLGIVGVLLGSTTEDGKKGQITSWVMSCRAFSRRIEFACLDALFAVNGFNELEFDFRPTDRNAPTQDALTVLLGKRPESGLVSLSREAFLKACPALYHQRTDT